MQKNLFNNLNSNTLILTPNHRLALTIQRQYNTQKIASKQQAWPTPKIIPINTWLQELWHNNFSTEVILNQHQEHLIWEKIINGFAKNYPLLNTNLTQIQAQKAYQLLQEWSLNLYHSSFTLTTDTQIFQTWALEFNKQLQQNHWATKTSIAGKIQKQLEATPIHLPKTIILAGFDELPPYLQKFITSLPCELQYFDPNQTASAAHQLECLTLEDEIVNAATWAQQLIQENPTVKIGCVIPELTNIHAQVTHIFDRIIPGQFDISVGKHFAHYPIIKLALDDLDNENNLTNNKPSYWANIFNEKTADIWQNLTNLTVEEGILIERFHQLLNDFSSLDINIKTQSYKKAVSLLKSIATKTIYQPKLKYDAKVQILGALEAAGLNFDYLWVMDLTDKTWPTAPQPNPFIPVSLQRQHNMPHASSQRELEFCQTLTQRFQRSAKEVIFSYHTQNKDAELAASPLLKDLPKLTQYTWDTSEFEFYAYNPEPLEIISDTKAPSIQLSETVHGGSRILKLQAMCPFKAFAECRLHAKALEKSELGLDAKTRGILVHKLLENSWKKFKDQQTLCSYSEAELKLGIKQLVQRTLKTVTNQTLAQLEQKRLEKLLYDWLTLEKTRLPFKVIAEEQAQTVSIDTLTDLKLRVDRIDQLEDGSLLIIDYKTGKASPNDWYGDRPDDPQLPLYCISSNTPIQGIVFAQVKTGELKFKGITNIIETIPNVKTTNKWEETLAHWHTSLTKLADDFYNGQAEIDPKYGINTTCKQCQLQSLCRIYDNE